VGNNVKLILFNDFLTYKQCVGKQFRSQTEGLLYLLLLSCKVREIFTQHTVTSLSGPSSL